MQPASDTLTPAPACASGGPAPVDVTAITATINRALAAHTVPPRYDELVDLETYLRGHLQLLLSTVRTAGPARRATTAAQLDRGLGPGLRSAIDQVLLLALDCRWLLRHIPTEGRPAR
ncbi:DUF6415 family natural product biosynthesis protein [Streptomyces sp. HK10]|uniref:DUF6415 family natural product biosynthesis protein n=1 Tax=Streptomyces sp. HK10 TaxID=3373255 RepID=UPI00374A0F2E